MKRGLDVVGALSALVLTAPLLLVAVLAVWITSRGPVFYRSPRIGRNGRVFQMHKLRTMYDGADARLAEVIHLNVASGMVKIPNDPRRTPVGRILRRLSIDELPQFWDVLRGEMSLVGPRPHVPGELPDDDPNLLARVAVTPGITGLWQVHARNHPALETRVKYDLDYIASWSLMVDLMILARTVPAVLRADGGAATAATTPIRSQQTAIEVAVSNVFAAEPILID